MSISVKRMKKLLKDDYQIIDIRSAAEAGPADRRCRRGSDAGR